MLMLSQHNHHPTMKYKHLSQNEREQIYDLSQEGLKKAEIARRLGRSKSTLGREIKRNSSVIERRLNNSPKKKKHYLPDTAQKKYEIRREKSKTPFPLKNPFIHKFTLKHLKIGWTPELISGYLKVEFEEKISHECIYQYIYGNPALELFEYLPRRHQKRRKYNGRKTRKVLIPNRTDISLRPEIVASRERFGDFEGDTIFGKGAGAALATVNERKSRYVWIRKLKRKTATGMKNAVIQSLSHLKGIETLTFDNGSENTKHEEIAKTLGIQIYFARPYHSWERGANERINGLIRRFYPKKTNFNNVSEAEIQLVQDLINHRPMKCLNFKTPAQVYQQHLNQLSASSCT
jgi:transposase, IS30 family